MSKVSVRSILHESLHLQLEQLRGDQFLEEWSQEKFGVGLDESLYTHRNILQQMLDEIREKMGQ
jgi:hypothetical protein